MSENLPDAPNPDKNMVAWLGVGIVAKNKDPMTDEVMVFVKKDHPHADGEVTSDVKIESRESSATAGTKQSSSVMKSNAKPAKWKGNDPNRITPPDVRVGSQVMLFKIKGSKQLYWTIWDLGPEKHRCEHVVYAFNASASATENVPFDFNNYYVLEVSPLNGRINITTSAANGEVTSYFFSLDGKKGQFSLIDTEGNLINLNSPKNTWLMRNADDSLINMAQKNISIMNKGDTLINSEQSISMKTNALSIDANTINVKAQQTDMVCPTTNWQGNINQIGNLGVQGNMTCTGGKGGGGDIKTSGNVRADADVIAGGISLRKHIHDVIDHSYTTAPKAG